MKLVGDAISTNNEEIGNKKIKLLGVVPLERIKFQHFFYDDQKELKIEDYENNSTLKIFFS
jgi:hypothetical protein